MMLLYKFALVVEMKLFWINDILGLNHLLYSKRTHLVHMGDFLQCAPNGRKTSAHAPRP